MGQTSLKLVEVVHIGKQLSNDEYCPAIGKNLRRTGYRTILAVKVTGCPNTDESTEEPTAMAVSALFTV